MSWFTNLVGGKGQGTQEEGASLLQDWNSYSARDVESGAASSSGADSLFKTVEGAGTNAGAKITELFSSVTSSVTTTVKGGVAALPTAETFRYRSVPHISIQAFKYHAALCPCKA